MYRRFLAVWTLSIATAAPLTWAQSAPASAKPHPQDANASVPGTIYRSSLAGYRLFSDEKVTSWKAANDNVGRIGGWRAYAKEAQEAGPAAGPVPPGADKPVPADSTKPMQGRSGGHSMN